MSDSEKYIDQVLLAEKILLSVVSILIITGNALVLLATWRERSLHQPNKYFIACLAVADLLVGIFIGPGKVYAFSAGKSLGQTSIHLCRFMIWIDTLPLTASIYSLMFISFDRCLKISKPLQYRSRMTTSKSLKIIFTIWLISTAFATYAATPDSGSWGLLLQDVTYCFDRSSERKVYVLYGVLSLVLLFLPAIVMLIMYARIFVVAHKRHKKLRNGELGENCTGQNKKSVLRQDLKIVRMLLIVVGVFLLCWFPSVISYLSSLYSPTAFQDWSWRLHVTYYRVMYLQPLINSLCNPIIYACLDQTYREAFKRLFHEMICRTRSSTQQPPAVIELLQLDPK